MKITKTHVMAALSFLPWELAKHLWPAMGGGTFGIVANAVGASQAGDQWDGLPANRNQFADQALNANATFAGCTSAFAAGVRVVRAYINMKNYQIGVSTNTNGRLGALFELQVATGAGGWAAGANQATTGTTVIAVGQTVRATSAFYMNGIIPDNGLTYAAARIVVMPLPGNFAITDTASFDCNIDAA